MKSEVCTTDIHIYSKQKKEVDAERDRVEEEEGRRRRRRRRREWWCLLFVCSFVCNQKHFDITRA